MAEDVVVLSKAELWRRVAEHNAHDTYERRRRAAEVLRRLQWEARHTIVTAPYGTARNLYCVEKDASERVRSIRRRHPKTGHWCLIWQRSQGNIGKRLMSVITLAGVKPYEASS